MCSQRRRSRTPLVAAAHAALLQVVHALATCAAAQVTLLPHPAPALQSLTVWLSVCHSVQFLSPLTAAAPRRNTRAHQSGADAQANRCCCCGAARARAGPVACLLGSGHLDASSLPALTRQACNCGPWPLAGPRIDQLLARHWRRPLATLARQALLDSHLLERRLLQDHASGRGRCVQQRGRCKGGCQLLHVLACGRARRVVSTPHWRSREPCASPISE